MNKKESNKGKLGRLMLCIVLSMFILAMCGNVVFANESNSVNVNVNGNMLQTDVNAFIDEKGRTLVPFRTFLQSIGVNNINYNAQTKEVIAKNSSGTEIKLIIGDYFAYVNGKRIMLDTQSRIFMDRTMIPLRFFSEQFGMNVSYDSGSRIVSVNSGSNINNVSNANQKTINIGNDNIISTPQQTSSTNSIPTPNEIPHEKIISQLLSTLNCNKVEGNQLTFGIVNDYNYGNTQKWNKLNNEEKERCAQLKLNQLKVAKYPGFKDLVEGESVVFILSEYATTGKILDQFNLIW